MGDTTVEFERRLLDRFPWGGSNPSRPEAEPARRQAVELWLGQQIDPIGAHALALHARIKPVLREQAEGPHTGPRAFARTDLSELLKRPASVLEKMARGWEQAERDSTSAGGGASSPPIDFHNFTREIDDLGRFRIVANFLSDARRIADAIRRIYDPEPLDLTDAARHLRDEFGLVRNQVESSIELLPRLKGERSWKAHFHPQAAPQTRIEVQIQTQLQEAWDKKDHFLIYEPVRRGRHVDHLHRCRMFAMSELLYVADLTFDELFRDIVEAERPPGGGS